MSVGAGAAKGKRMSRRIRLIVIVLCEVLALATVTVLVQDTSTPLDAAPASITEENQQVANDTLAPVIAANPVAAQLSPATKARVDQAAANMTPDERAVFVTGVQAAQVKLADPAEQARFKAALIAAGYTPEQAEALKTDPIAMNVIPVAVEKSEGRAESYVDEEVFVGADGKEHGFSRTSAAPRCPSGFADKSTYPQMYAKWEGFLGYTLASVSWYRSWCWGAPSTGGVVTAVTRWEDPHFNPTGNCVGCTFETTWHDEYHYDYNGNGWSGYAN